MQVISYHSPSVCHRPVFHHHRRHRHRPLPVLTRCSECPEEVQEDTKEEKDVVVKMALGALGFYRSTISPLMPKSCRFVPSCSEYSIESFQNYGAVKGVILTVWRLLRCNPFGGKGFDPPKWPPIGLEWIFNSKE